MRVLFRKNAKKLFKTYKSNYGLLNPPEIDKLQLQVVQLSDKGDVDTYFKFYETNAPYFVEAHDNFDRKLFYERFLRKGWKALRATLKGRTIGWAVLAPPSALWIDHHQIGFPCVERSEQEKKAMLYMFLCGFLFAKKKLKAKQIAVPAYPGKHEITSIGELSLFKKKEGELESGSDKYNYWRQHLLYHVFEEIFGQKLAALPNYMCYIIDL